MVNRGQSTGGSLDDKISCQRPKAPNPLPPKAPLSSKRPKSQGVKANTSSQRESDQSGLLPSSSWPPSRL